jgi:DegV family protein with EDD domain
MIQVITDSTSDVPEEVARRLGIIVLPMLVEVDGKTHRDGVDLTRQQFYDQLPSYAQFPKTAAASPEVFADAYRAARAAGAEGVVSIHIARTVSGVYNAAELAANDAAKEGFTVRVVDSGSMTIGLGWQVIAAAEMAKNGASLDAITSTLEAMKPRIRILAMADTLKYLHKGGRVSSLTAGIGELLKIRLIIELKQGKISQVDRVRSRSRGIQRLIAEAKKLAGIAERLAILYTVGSTDEDLAQLRQALQPLAPIEPAEPVLITPVIGAHFGPGGLGIAVLTR